MRRLFIWKLSFVGVVFLSPLYSTTWTVDTTDDTASGSGTSGSLRYCISNAANGDTIDFDDMGSSATITLSGTGSLLAIEVSQSSLTIQNTSGTTIYISGNSLVPIFYIADTADLTLSNVNLIDGLALGGSGGAGSASSGTTEGGAGGGGAGLGGAIFIEDGGSATISNVAFSSNTAQGGNGGSAGSGSEAGGGGGAGAGGNAGSGGSGPPYGGGGGGGGGGWGLGNGGGGGGQYSGSGQSGGTGSSGDGGKGGTDDSGATSATGGGGGGGASPFDTDATAGGFGGGGGGGGSSTNGADGGFGGGGGGAESGTSGSGGYGGGDGAVTQGGGGAGFGGAIFVRQGGSLTLGDEVSFSSNDTIAGSGGGGSANNGLEDGDDLYINSGATLTFSPTADVVFSSEIAGDTENSGGGVVIDASSSDVQVSFTADNEYGGSTTITQGILYVLDDSNLGASTTSVVLDGGTLATDGSFTLGSSRAVSTSSSESEIDVYSSGALEIDQNISGTGGITLGGDGSGTLTLGGTNDYSGGTTIDAGILSIATDRGLGATSGFLTLNGGTLEVTGTTVTLSGSRTVTTSSASSEIDVEGTTFTIGQSIGGTGGLTVTSSDSGTLVLSSGSGNAFSGGLTINTSATLSVSADYQLGGTGDSLTLTGGTLAITGDTTLTRSVGVTDNSTTSAFYIDSGMTLTVPSANSIEDGEGGDGGIILSGPGTLLIEGTCTYSNDTSIDDGTLALSGSGSIADSRSVYIASGAILDLTATTQDVTMSTLSGDGTLSTPTSAVYNLIIDQSDDDSSFYGSLSGDSALEITGDYYLDLSGVTNNLPNGVTISGDLRIDDDSQLGSGSTLLIDTGALGANGSFTLGNSYTRDVSVGSDYGYLYALDGCTLTVPQDIGDGDSGTGALITDSDDEGTVVLSSSSGNSFGGGLYLYGGIAEVSQDNQLGSTTGSATGYIEFDNGTLYVTTGFTLDSARSIATYGSDYEYSSEIDVADGETFTIPAAISGDGGFKINNRTGTGTVVFQGACTYTGTTEVDSGTLALTDSGSIADAGYTIIDATLDTTGLSASPVTVYLQTLSGSSDGAIIGTSGQALYIYQNNDDGTFAGSISGFDSGFTKDDSDELDLTGVNTYTGGTEIADGTLGINNEGVSGGSLGDVSGSLDIGDATLHVLADVTLNTSRTVTFSSSDTTIDIDGTYTFTINQDIADGSSAGALILTSDDEGTLVLGGTNSYSGGTVIESGILSIAANEALGNTDGDLDLEGGYLEATATFSLTSRSVTTGSYGGGIDIAAGQVLTIPEAIVNTPDSVGALNVNPLGGTGTLTLEAACTYTGSTVIDGGELILTLDGAIADASETVVDGTLDTTGVSATSVTIPTLSGSSSGSINGASGQTLYIVQGSDETYAGGISGFDTVIKQGSSTLIFSGGSSYDVGTTVEDGILSVSADDNLGASTNFLALSGGTLEVTASFTLNSDHAVSTTSIDSGISVDDGVTFVMPQDITGAGAITVTSSGSGVLELNGTNAFSDGLTIESGIVAIQQDRGLGALGGALSLDGGTLQVTTNDVTLDDTRTITFEDDTADGIDIAADKTLTISQGISGGGSITINPLTGTGTLILEGDCSYTGATTLSAGTLTLTGTGSIADSESVTLSSGTLDLTGVTANVSLNNLSGSGDVEMPSSSDYTISITQTGNNELDGALSGAASFELASGDDTFTLTNANTDFTGAVIINAGTLALSGDGSIANSSSLALASGTVLDITGISPSSASVGPLSGAGSIYTTGKTISIAQTADGTFTGTISGTGGAFEMASTSSQTLTLDGASLSYDGETDLAGGTLAISGSTSLSNSSAVAIAAEATLDVSDSTLSSVTLNTISSAGGDLIATGQSLIFNQTADESFYGVITGDGASLYYTGGSNLTLYGANTFTGSTEINDGTITLSESGSLADSSSMTIDSDGTLDTSAVTLTGGAVVSTLSGSGAIATGSLFTVVQDSPGEFSGNISGDAQFILQGSSILVLSGTDNTYTGGTKIEDGILSIASDVLGDSSGSVEIAGGVFRVTDTLILGDERAIQTSSSLSGIDVAGGEFGANLLTLEQAITDGTTDGGITFTSSGTGNGVIILKSECTYHGPTTVNSGTLVLYEDASLPNSSSMTIADGAILDIAETTSGATLNTLSGAGELSLGEQTATINQTTAESFSGTITGTTGSFVKTGSATLTLSGSASYTGTTTVSEGQLALNTSVSGGISILSSGTLSGVCTIGGDVVVDGTIAPGNSPGTITILSTLSLNSGSETDIAITPSTSSELVVAGAVTLGGDLVITAGAGIYLGQTQYTIITAGGYVTPDTSFASVSGGASGSELSISYGYDGVNIISVILTYLTQLRDVSLTGNPLNFINYLNQNTDVASLESIITILAGLSGDQLEKAAILCTPARNATATFASQNTMFAFSRSISTHMADQRLLRSMYKRSSSQQMPPEQAEFLTFFDPRTHKGAISSVTPAGSVRKMAKEENSYSVWIDGFSEFSHQNAQHQIPSFNVISGGVLLGVDAYLNNRGEVGAAVGYARDAVDEGQSQGQNSANLFTATLYGTYYVGNAYFESAIWGTYDQTQTKRTVVFPGFEGEAEAHFSGAQVTPHLGIGYDIGFNCGVFEPFATIDWVFNFEDGYTEHGASPLNMHVQGTNSSMWRLETGLNCYQSWESEEILVIFKEMASYVYKQPYSVGKTVAAIVGANGTFFNDSFTKAQSLASPSFEIFFRTKGSDSYCSLLYEGEFGDGYQANEVLIRIGKYF